MTKSAQILTPAVNGDMPRISDPKDFDYDAPMLVELSTGRVIEMVLGEVETFLDRGEIPNELIGVATRELLPPPEDETEEQTATRVMERFKLAKWTCRHVVKRGGPTEAFAAAEKWEVYRLANNPALLLANFRRQQAIHVELLAQQQDAGMVAKSPTAGAE